MLDQQIKKKIFFNSSVTPYIRYTAGVYGWGGTALCYTDSTATKRAEKIIIKLISNRSRRYSTEQLFNEYKEMNAKRF